MNFASYLPWELAKEIIKELKKGSETDKRSALIINLGIHVALRASDLLSLKWSEVLTDALGDGITVVEAISKREKKTGKVRLITLHSEVRTHLLNYSKIKGINYEAGNIDTYIFPGRNPDQPLTTRYVNAEFARLKERFDIDVETFSTHSLRKTWARHLWEKSGRDPGMLTKLGIALNHGDITTTRRYLGIERKEIADLYLSV